MNRSLTLGVIALTAGVCLASSPNRGLSPRGASALRSPSAQAEAEEAYRRGRARWQTRSAAGLLESLEDFRKAVSLDPDFALAWAGLANSACLLGLYSVVLPLEVMPQGKEAAGRALELDPGLAEAHASMGLVAYLYDWNFAGAEKSFRRALELDPSYATAHHWYAMMLAANGRGEEAVAHMEEASRQDPDSRLLKVKTGTVLAYAGHLGRARTQLERAVQQFPDDSMARRELGFVELKAGRPKEALEAFQRAAERSRGSRAWGGLGHTYALLGLTSEARRVLDRLLAARREGYLPPLYVAMVYAGLGEEERAMEWLLEAEEAHDPGLVYLRVKAGFEPLRDDPGFKDLVARIGLGPSPTETAAGVSDSGH